MQLLWKTSYIYYAESALKLLLTSLMLYYPYYENLHNKKKFLCCFTIRSLSKIQIQSLLHDFLYKIKPYENTFHLHFILKFFCDVKQYYSKLSKTFQRQNTKTNLNGILFNKKLEEESFQRKTENRRFSVCVKKNI